MRTLRFQSVVGLLLVSTTPCLVRAECLDTDKARTAYDLGERATAARNTELAVSNFLEANRLCPNPNTQLAIATAYLLGQRALEAREALNRYINDAGANTDWCSAINMRRQVTLLEGGPEHLLTINVTPKSARVFVREASAAAPVGTPGCQVQPSGGGLAVALPSGSYTVTAVLESQISRIVPVDLTKPGTVDITFNPPMTTPTPNPTSAGAAGVPNSKPALEKSVETAGPNWTQRPENWLWIGAGVAAAASAATGIWALSLESDLDRTCGEQRRCPASAWSEVDKHDTLATVSTVGLVLAAASAATGAGIFFWRQRAQEPHASTLHTRKEREGTHPWRASIETASLGATLKPGYVTLDWRF